MSIEGEAAGDVLTGAVIAHTVEGRKTGADHETARKQGPCLNCGAQLTGAYCSACGQAAHIHRSLSSLGHDILHGVFHFEGKVWKTLPELFLHPGRLTRRYIDGERAKFVSPMALYLFTVFLMFAVFGFLGGPFPKSNSRVILPDGTVQTKTAEEGLAKAIGELDDDIANTRAKLAAPDLSAEERVDLEAELQSTQAARNSMAMMASGDLSALVGLNRDKKAAEPAAADPENTRSSDAGSFEIHTGSKSLDDRLAALLKDVKENPRLLLYKLKTNGYKFSWALIPLSVPFLWILFFWRRDVHVYDHAIFVTYSITFIMLLLVLVSILNAFHVSAQILGFATLLVPIHMYKQLRGTYGLSRFGAFGRLIFLLISALIVLSLFSLLLVALGVMG
jgi:hypothetical protein